MERSETIIQQLKKQKLLPLFFHADNSTCIETAKALYAAGIRLIEFTNRGEAALENFKVLINERNNSIPDMLLAVGTIRTAEQANKFIEAGADCLVSPVFDAAVCDAAYLNKVLWIPGCMTPTEIHSAEQSGCKLVKLFPGNVLGPSFVSGIKELFPGVDFMPTGGVDVNKENLEAWFASGACAVGMGSKLISRKLLDAKDYRLIEKNTREILSLIHAITQ